MLLSSPCSLRNGTCVLLEDIPRLPLGEWRDALLCASEFGDLLAALFGVPAEKDMLRLYAVMANERSGELSVLSTDVGSSFPSLTADCPQACEFERELAEQWGVVPEGHPELKPLRFHAPYRAGFDAWKRAPHTPIAPCVTEFYRVEGEEVHEVAVGPVHAGIIEPGHFRFQCHGEQVLSLEISLGYQHRGMERALRGGPSLRSVFYAETLAGDTTIGHTSAYCQLVEALGQWPVPARAQALRAVALELERLANHTGDLGALAGDIGYLPTSSYCGRLRGDFLNLSALLCGSRFGRGMVRPGGCAFDVEPSRGEQFLERLEAAVRDTTRAVELLWDTPSVLARFEATGTLSREVARETGLVGLAARACGLERDVRFTHPSGIYQFCQIPVSTWETGDVFARAWVRWMEIQRSASFLREQMENLPAGEVRTLRVHEPLAPKSFAVTLVEGWRGQICHCAVTDREGRFVAYKIVDPSFHNWRGLALALRGQQICDFPLCNKSFNLSYCGHDL